MDRAKSGTKRSLLTDSEGVPLAIAVDAANRHDSRLVADTLDAIVAARPKPTRRRRQHLCADKGYDYRFVRDLLEEFGYTIHIPVRGKQRAARRTVPRYRARRWVVERSHSWINRFRRLLIRWEKKVDNYLALLHFACAWITLRAAGVLG